MPQTNIARCLAEVCSHFGNHSEMLSHTTLLGRRHDKRRLKRTGPRALLQAHTPMGRTLFALLPYRGRSARFLQMGPEFHTKALMAIFVVRGLGPSIGAGADALTSVAGHGFTLNESVLMNPASSSGWFLSPRPSSLASNPPEAGHLIIWIKWTLKR